MVKIISEYSVPEVTVYYETSLAQHGTEQSKSCLCLESHLDVEEIKKTSLAQHGTDQSKSCLCPESHLDVEEIKKTSLPSHETDQSKSCLCPESSLDVNKIIKKLMDYNIDLQHHMIYFDLYCDNTEPEVFFNSIHEVWKYHPDIEFTLRLLCCKRLLENKHYDILNRLIQNNEEYFSINHNNFGPNERFAIIDLWDGYADYLTVLLILLCNNVTSRQIAKMYIALFFIVSRLSYYSYTTVSRGSNYFMLFTLSLKQTRLIPSLIKVLLNRPELHCLSSSIISLFNERLLEVDCHNTYNKSMDCIKANSHFILNLPFLLEERECYVRQTHCKLLLTLLHAYVMCDDLTNMDHVLNRLQEFRHSLLQSANIACDCFLGKQNCYVREQMFDDRKNTSRFKSSLLSLTINDLRNKVIKEKLEPVQYLKPMIDALEKYLKSGEDLREEFISFIEQISLQKTTGLYDIIKTLCDLEMQPEIQDMFIQGLTDYIHVKCNKQNSIYSRLLLDINMTCYKGEFLKKLTIKMGKLLLIDVDTGNDVEKIIYRCFCIVRHENKEIDIAKYQEYFTFISTMDAEDKMLKMSNLRSFLLMLILLMISSGSQHKSAKLKKYLSLKYAYEDAILYLLWCSGDVEINPGPTRSKLKRKADSEKRGNGFLKCEITAWKSDKPKLLELCVKRWEIEDMRTAKDLLFTYKENPDLKQNMKDYNVNLSFNPNSTQEESPKGYSDVVRDLATTFCRISNSLPILVKKMACGKHHHMTGTNDLYYDPGNTAKRHEKDQDQKLVDDLLLYCEKKFIPIPSELQLVVKAWKLKTTKKYVNTTQSEGLLEKPDVQQSLKQIGVSLHCEKSSYQHKNDSTINTDNKSKVSGLPMNALSNNLRGTYSSSSLCSTRDSDIDCSQHPYEAKALTNSHSTKSVIKCSKPDFQNHPSTSGCTIYSKKAPCQDNRIDLQSIDERLEFSDSHTILYERSNEETHFQSSTLSCTTYSKRAPCRENSGDLQYTDERLDIPDSQKCVSEILCQKPDFQPSSSGCSSFIKRPECLNVRENVQSTERIQKRRRPSSEERSDKRPRLHSGNESQASTSSITRCNGDNTPSSHCDSDIVDQCVNSTGYMEDSSDQSSNRITPPDNIQDTDSSKDDIFGPEDEIPQHLEEIIDRYIIMSCDNLEENLEENFGEDLEHIDRLFGEDLEHIDRLLKLWETL
ncbi:unnamed protein product [Mytilus edulis]|uniref:Uncharacterized protein n=1 Tax=Mytilus edulis TaxID=6550 RepID=A0A8S3R6Y1_MYTED|nr:unnamed protein product [Mytilus edulis]